MSWFCYECQIVTPKTDRALQLLLRLNPVLSFTSLCKPVAFNSALFKYCLPSGCQNAAPAHNHFYFLNDGDRRRVSMDLTKQINKKSLS